jgi:SNF2 family DNA or RNA helicase
MTLIEIIKNKIKQVEIDKEIGDDELKLAKLLYIEGNCQMISRGKLRFDFVTTWKGRNVDFSIAVNSETNEVHAIQNNISYSWDKYVIACLYQLLDELNWQHEKMEGSGIKYTRDGMIQRVLKERRQRALGADYSLQLADNIYGEHTLINETGKIYKITLRDFEKETGYIDSIDLRTNKLGTTKHIMWLFDKLKQEPELMDSLSKTYPFVEIFLDPLNEYKITWFYPHEMDEGIKVLIDKYFGHSKIYPDNKVTDFLSFIEEARFIENIVIRPDVMEKVEIAFEEQMLQKLLEDTQLDYSQINLKLYEYQKEGIQFATFRRSAIIADEFGLGKTVQAIGTAIFKKEILGFKKTLIICSSSLIENWKTEIDAVTKLNATIINGSQQHRNKLYKNTDSFFYIVSYETGVNDTNQLSELDFDFVILDETQKIKNYQTKTSNVLKSIKRKHSLVLSDTPVEDKLIELYSIVGFVDPYFLTPLWEFSYQHCLFDANEKDKIMGYYNLSNLKKKLDSILIRRDKQSVLRQIPNISEVTVPVKMHPIQQQHYNKYLHNIKQLIQKKMLTKFDIRKIFHQLNNLRMVCNSTYLIDNNTQISPKLQELKSILTQRINIATKPKIIIYSEWQTMNRQIALMLKNEGILFVELNSNISEKNKTKLLDRFLTDNCNILLTTDFIAKELTNISTDYVINFEVPWNPETRSNRIGQINVIANNDKKCTIINLVTELSIEKSIVSGKMQKHGVISEIFNPTANVDYIDIEHPGINQVLKELDEVINDFEFTETEIVDYPKTLFEDEKKPDLTSENIVKLEKTLMPNYDYYSILDSSLQNMKKTFETITKNNFEYSDYTIDYDKSNDEFIIILKKNNTK